MNNIPDISTLDELTEYINKETSEDQYSFPATDVYILCMKNKWTLTYSSATETLKIKDNKGNILIYEEQKRTALLTKKS